MHPLRVSLRRSFQASSFRMQSGWSEGQRAKGVRAKGGKRRKLLVLAPCLVSGRSLGIFVPRKVRVRRAQCQLGSSLRLKYLRISEQFVPTANPEHLTGGGEVIPDFPPIQVS
jgi:hypothetical protein